MSAPSQPSRCIQNDLVSALALGALDPDERAVAERHVAACPDCQRQIAVMDHLIGAFAHWPTDVLRPSPSLWARLVDRIGAEAEARSPAAATWTEPEWDEMAPGLWCKLLASDADRDRVSMLVRLAPGVEYPPHHHAGVEELHLLDGELWIDDRKLAAGDYSRAEPGSVDQRVWSETGCTCVLVTSTRDALR